MNKPVLLILLFLLPLISAAQDECYQLVWSDEFDYEGAPDPEKWGYDLGGGGWGNPLDRDPEKVKFNAMEGLLSFKSLRLPNIDKIKSLSNFDLLKRDLTIPNTSLIL